MMENYLNPPEAATREQGGIPSEMELKLQAALNRLYLATIGAKPKKEKK